MASPSSSASLSPSHPPSSPHAVPPGDGSSSVPLPGLVAHLIAARRSLSATAHVQRANDLVSTARGYIEELAVLSARNAFLRKNVQRELRLLEVIRRRLDAVRDSGVGEFRVVSVLNSKLQSVLRTLDTADARVKETLHLLETTPVEPSFQQDGKSQPSPDSSEASNPVVPPEECRQKCLYDFVSEQGVDNLTNMFRQCIDATNDATETFVASNESFDRQLQDISDAISSSSPINSPRQRPRRLSAEPDTPDAERDSSLDETTDARATFHTMESHATEMASLLESLVRHYDLCVTALKHTEGGGEAARKAQAQVDIPGGLGDLEREVPHEPISEEERNQMIAVLEKDALEVDDVVHDIRGYAVEMEDQLQVFSNRVETLKNDHTGLDAAVNLLHELGNNLPLYIEASVTFLDRWAEQKAKIEQNMEELEALRDFYDGFLKAYDGLILEIERRRVVQAKMDRVVADAATKVSKLYDEDMAEREAFKVEQGEYLPSDIWPGLVNPPVKFELRRSGDEAGTLPEISKAAMQRAMQRHGRKL